MSFISAYLDNKDIKPLIEKATKEERDSVFHMAFNNSNLDVVEILYPYMSEERIQIAVLQAISLGKGQESIKWLGKHLAKH